MDVDRVIPYFGQDHAHICTKDTKEAKSQTGYEQAGKRSGW